MHKLANSFRARGTIDRHKLAFPDLVKEARSITFICESENALFLRAETPETS